MKLIQDRRINYDKRAIEKSIKYKQNIETYRLC